MSNLLTFYIYQFKRLHKFSYWETKDKIKFTAITYGIIFISTMMVPVESTFGEILIFFYGFSVIIFTFLGIKKILKKIIYLFANPYKLYKNKLLIEEVDKMSGTGFEELLYHLYEHQGYIVKQTPRSGDYGADLVLRKSNDIIVVQAKRYQNNIGVAAVNEVIASAGYYKANKKWVVTNRYYTDNAIIQAHNNKVKLVTRDDLILMLNEHNTRKVKIEFPKKKYFKFPPT